MGTCDAFDKHWILFSSMWNLQRLSQGRTQGRLKCVLGWLKKLTHVPLAIAILFVISVNKLIWLECYLCYRTQPNIYLKFWRFWSLSEAFIRKKLIHSSSCSWHDEKMSCPAWHNTTIRLSFSSRAAQDQGNDRQGAGAPHQVYQRGCKYGEHARNWDEGSYQLCHGLFLDTAHLPVVLRSGGTEYQLLLTKASDETETLKFKVNNWLCLNEL